MRCPCAPMPPLHVVEGISLADDQPVSLFRSAFCATRFPELGRHLASGDSITRALRALGVPDYTRKIHPHFQAMPPMCCKPATWRSRRVTCCCCQRRSISTPMAARWNTDAHFLLQQGSIWFWTGQKLVPLSHKVHMLGLSPGLKLKDRPMTTLPDLRLTGALCLVGSTLEDTDIALSGEQIVAPSTQMQTLDLTGYWVLPGIVDLHGDGFERHIRPRPSAPFDKRAALLAADTELACQGVTTAWFAQSWSWEGGARSPDEAVALLDARRQIAQRLGTDIRIQLRFETHMPRDHAALMAVVREYHLDYIVFNISPARSVGHGPQQAGPLRDLGRVKRAHTRHAAGDCRRGAQGRPRHPRLPDRAGRRSGGRRRYAWVT